MEKPIVAAFDFDGTLSRGESGLRFLRYLLGDFFFFLFFVAFFPFFLAYALHWHDEKIMQWIVYLTFKGRDVKKTEDQAKEFAKRVMPSYLKPEVMKKLIWHQKQGDRCVLVSRSFALYLKPWAKQAGFADVVATELEEEGDKFSGKMSGKSCAREEKVDRLFALLGDRDGYCLYAYADSVTDKPLLDQADQAIWVK